MKRMGSESARRTRRRTVRGATGAGVALTLLGGVGAFAATAGPWGDGQVGTTNAGGATLLATNQEVNPIGTRFLEKDFRMLSSALSPNGQFMAVLSWREFVGFLSIINVKTGAIVQQVKNITGGDGTVAADGPLWSADGTSLWFPQTADLVHFNADPATGMVSNPVVINLQTQQDNLNGSPTTVADEPSGMALSQDGSKLYVALNGVNQLGVIDTATNQVLQQIAVGNAPRQVVLVGNRAYVSNEGGRPARPGDFTNQTDGTPVVADKSTGGATTGTVSVVDLATGTESREIPVGLQPTAEYLAKDGTLMVANSNDDSLSMIDTGSARVVQTVNVNPLPIPQKVGSYPNAITMPDPGTIVVSIGRDNALAVYSYKGARNPVRYQGLLPTDFYPVNVTPDPATGRIIVTNDRGIGSRGTPSTISKGPGTQPATDYNTYDSTSSLTEFTMPSADQISHYTAQVFTDNAWTNLLSQHGKGKGGSGSAPVPVPAKLGQPSTIKHVFLIVRENRTYDQVLGDVAKGNGSAADAQFGQTVTPNAHALANDFGLYDNFYDPSTLSADGHNWIVQADANDYIEKEFGAFYRSYPAQGGDALAYQRDGFLWNSVQAAGKSVADFGEYNNFFNQQSPTPSWQSYYKDSQILEGRASGPLPVPESSVHTYSDIPSLNSIDYTEYPPFDLGIPDQYRTDVWQQAFSSELRAGRVPNLTMIWLPDDHTGGSSNPYPVAQVADNDLALGRIIDSISHSSVWPSSAVFVMEDDAQNGVDHVDGHRAPLLIASPWAKRGVVDHSYYNQVNTVRTIEQILGAAPMNQEDRAAEPMTAAFTTTPDLTPFDHLASNVCLTYGAPGGSATESCPSDSAPTSPSSVSAAAAPSASSVDQMAPNEANVPAAERGVYQQWLIWERSGRFSGAHPMQDWTNAGQLNRFDWYSAHNWSTPYPGDKTILTPRQVPGSNLPAGYLSDS